MDMTVCASGLLAFVLYLNTLDADFAYDDRYYLPHICALFLYIRTSFANWQYIFRVTTVYFCGDRVATGINGA